MIPPPKLRKRKKNRGHYWQKKDVIYHNNLKNIKKDFE